MTRSYEKKNTYTIIILNCSKKSPNIENPVGIART